MPLRDAHLMETDLSSLPFQQFPREIHFLIADKLDPDAIAALSITNRYLNSVYSVPLEHLRKALPLTSDWHVTCMIRDQKFPAYSKSVKNAISSCASRTELLKLIDAGREFGYRRYGAELSKFLVHAIKTLNLVAARAILDLGVDVNRTVKGYHPIHYASRIPDLNKVHGMERYELEHLARSAPEEQFVLLQWLLDSGAKVNSLTSLGETPLMKAAECGQLDIIKFLVNKGAWANMCTKKGTTALSLACRRTFRPMCNRPGFQVFVREDLRLATVKYLVELKVPISLPSGSQTGLQAAVRAQHHRIVEFLLDMGADPNAIDRKHNCTTPFIEAIRNVDETDIILFLKLAGDRINFDAMDGFGKTAMEYAIETKQRSVVELMEDVKARQSDKTKGTPERLRSPKRLNKKPSMGNGTMRKPQRLFFGSG